MKVQLHIQFYEILCNSARTATNFLPQTYIQRHTGRQTSYYKWSKRTQNLLKCIKPSKSRNRKFLRKQCYFLQQKVKNRSCESNRSYCLFPFFDCHLQNQMHQGPKILCYSNKTQTSLYMAKNHALQTSCSGAFEKFLACNKSFYI